MITRPRSEYTDSLIIVISVDEKDNAEQIAKEADGSVDNVFSLELSPTGTPPATHYWCGWTVTPEQHDVLKTIEGTIFDAEQTSPDEVLTQLGLQCIETEEMLES